MKRKGKEEATSNDMGRHVLKAGGQHAVCNMAERKEKAEETGRTKPCLAWL